MYQEYQNLRAFLRAASVPAEEVGEWIGLNYSQSSSVFECEDGRMFDLIRNDVSGRVEAEEVFNKEDFDGRLGEIYGLPEEGQEASQ